MKEKNIEMPRAPVLPKETQCMGKYPHKLARRAIEESGRLARENPDLIFVAYKCPHCKNYHVGTMKKPENTK